MSGSDFDEETVLVDDSEDSLSENELSYYDTSKEHLKYVLPFVPANILITGGALVSGKLLTEAGSEVIAALPYIYSFFWIDSVCKHIVYWHRSICCKCSWRR